MGTNHRQRAKYMDVDNHTGITTRDMPERKMWEEYLAIQEDATDLLSSTPSMDIYQQAVQLGNLASVGY